MKEIEDAPMGACVEEEMLWVVYTELYNFRRPETSHIFYHQIVMTALLGAYLLIPISQIRKWRSLDVNVNCPEDEEFVADRLQTLRLQNFCSLTLCTVLGINSN